MPYAGQKGRGGRPAQVTVRNAYTSLFEHCRDELDEHHTRREKIIKASRDITALSKKIIQALQRIRQINPQIPDTIAAETATRLEEISRLLASIAPDVQGINRWRYARNMSCLEELVEALTFAYYLQHQELVSFRASVDFVTDACRKGVALATQEQEAAGADAGADVTMEGAEDEKQLPEVLEAEKRVDIPVIELNQADYFGGVFDLTGEVMRFATVTAALHGELASRSTSESGGDANSHPRTVCSDMQELRSFFEMLPPPKRNDFQWGKKMEVMRQSVRKVERLGYELRVRGSERPKGWMPDDEPVEGGEEG